MDLLVARLSALGFETKQIEFDQNGSYRVNNLVARFGSQTNAIYFAGHTDVVEAGGSGWLHNPFAAEIVEGKLYGRGAVDMKCAIACFISAVARFLAQNPKPKFGIGLLLTNDEEADGVNGTKQALKWMKENNYKISGCIVGEPTNDTKLGQMIKIGRRGSVNFALKIIGKQGHVAYPENALNPISILTNILKVLQDHKLDAGNEFFDPSNLEVTHVSSPDLGTNVIVPEAVAKFNVRFNNFHTSNSIIELVKKYCESLCLTAKYELNFRVSGESFLSKPGKLADIFTKAVKEVSGVKPKLGTTGGTSDARFIKDYCEVIEYGLINQTAHQVNEYALVSDIKALAETYLAALNLIE